MTVTMECACGARMVIDDASELACHDLMAEWYQQHTSHRRTLEEYREELASFRQIGGLT